MYKLFYLKDRLYLCFEKVDVINVRSKAYCNKKADAKFN